MCYHTKFQDPTINRLVSVSLQNFARSPC